MLSTITTISRVTTSAPRSGVAAVRRQQCRLHTAGASSSGSERPAGQQEQPVIHPTGRRDVLLAGLFVAGSAASASVAAPPSWAETEPGSSSSSSSSSASDNLVQFSNPGQGYSLLRPSGWEQVDKAGADSLFRDPGKKSTNVGVTVYPVMIASLDQFGDLQAVGERLLGAERAKESTLSVAMVAQTARSESGVPVYDFEYELESTRGRKRILSTVTIAGRKLYISNGNISCGKETCSTVEQALPLVRRVTQSLAVGA
ncbi:PsbP domain-containing protein 2 [Chlorella vulgaris]